MEKQQENKSHMDSTVRAIIYKLCDEREEQFCDFILEIMESYVLSLSLDIEFQPENDSEHYKVQTQSEIIEAHIHWIVLWKFKWESMCVVQVFRSIEPDPRTIKGRKIVRFISFVNGTYCHLFFLQYEKWYIRLNYTL